MTDRVAVVVVTHNRAHLLEHMLAGLAAQTRVPDRVFVVDNASSDHTREVLERTPLLDQVAIHLTDNLGGAGGFHHGLERAYDEGFHRIWLMDDDVVPAPDCLETLLAHGGPCLMPVREDTHGRLVEKAATRFDLRNPLAIRPKRASVESEYADRAAMPPTVPIEVVAFEGFLVHRDVVTTIGLPDPAYFIFYDDADYAIRARRAGFAILAVRDAVLVRQLDFDQQHALESWKGYYMYRNLFVVHFRHGQNLPVRLKPYAVTAAVTVLSPLRGGRAEAGNALRALRDARRMR